MLKYRETNALTRTKYLQIIKCTVRQTCPNGKETHMSCIQWHQPNTPTSALGGGIVSWVSQRGKQGSLLQLQQRFTYPWKEATLQWRWEESRDLSTQSVPVRDSEYQHRDNGVWAHMVSGTQDTAHSTINYSLGKKANSATFFIESDGS